MDAKQLEKQVERIHRLLVDSGAEVKWNHRIADPDNPEQLRQIDVTVKRGSNLTIIECRAHKSPQDVKWVEELYGRKISLRADGVVGVSSSGFTAGAKSKANFLGVHLRDFSQLSADEIKHWGCNSKMSIVFYEFTNLIIRFELSKEQTKDGPITNKDGSPVVWRDFFIRLVESTELKNVKENKIHFRGAINAQILVGGQTPLSIAIKSDFRRLVHAQDVSTFAVYSDPADVVDAQKAQIESFAIGESQIIRGREAAALVFDLSGIKLPPDSFVAYPMFDAGSPIAVRNAQIMGEAKIFESDVRINIELARPI